MSRFVFRSVISTVRPVFAGRASILLGLTTIPNVFEHHSFATSASSRRSLASAAGIAFRKVVVSGETNCLTSTTLEGASWVMCGIEGGLEIFGSLSKSLRGLFPVFCIG
jgi:hypothetical protein